MSRLDDFTDEELQVMYRGSQGSFIGWSMLSPTETDKIIFKFHDELEQELTIRYKNLQEKIERETPRCECCNQRIEKTTTPEDCK